MASSLPDSPSLDKLRAHARRLQRACRSGDPSAIELVRRRHPRPEVAAAQGFPLAAAQLVVARQFGFAGWPALRAYLDQVAVLGRDTPADDEITDSADRFCLLACLRYDRLDDPARWSAATALLAEDPTVVQRSIHAAAAAGDVEAVRAALDRGAEVDLLAGPLRWTPLMSLAYSRAGTGDPVAAASVLVEAGADVDAGILLAGLATPFTVLTGVFGEGEMGAARQPAHPQWRELADLLLDAGAEPNDAQTLYNRMFRRGTAHLELLFEHGLGNGDGGPWRRLLGAATESVQEMMDRQVDWAADHAMPERLELLAQNGFGPGAEGVRDIVQPAGPGRTVLHDAAFNGDLLQLHELLQSGADPYARDVDHDATPRDWAEFARQDDAAAVLLAWEQQHPPA